MLQKAVLDHASRFEEPVEDSAGIVYFFNISLVRIDAFILNEGWGFVHEGWELELELELEIGFNRPLSSQLGCAIQSKLDNYELV